MRNTRVEPALRGARPKLRGARRTLRGARRTIRNLDLRRPTLKPPDPLRTTETDKAIRILIADDHDVVRRGLRAFLDLDSGLEVVGEAVNGAEAVHFAHRLRPDVGLMDLAIPELDGIAATEVIHRELPNTNLLVLTSL